MHSVEAALTEVLGLARPTESETVSLSAAVGRVLREPVAARADVPIAAASLMDGFAVACGGPLRLRVGVESAAGAPRTRALAADEAAPISTGALLPPGADAVVPIEDATREGDVVTLAHAPVVGAFVRAPGADLRAGEPLLTSGELISPTALAILAGEGRAHVRVAMRPRVAIVSMGRELRPVGAALARGELHDANGPALAALCAASGAHATVAPLVGDDPEALTAVLRTLDADVILTSGGASVGPHDHLRAAIASAGGEVRLWRVAMKPGKPLVLARLRERPLIGLPGNPVSAIVSFWLFVHPLLRAILGATSRELPRRLVRLAAPLPVAGDRRTYVRARLHEEGGELVATPEPRQGSSALLSLHRAGALIPVEPGAAPAAPGDRVPALLLA